MPITTCTLNLRAKLAAALAALGLFTACEDPTDIGVGIDPASEQIGVTFFDTEPVEAATLLLDSVNTSKASTTSYISTLLVGDVTDNGSPFQKVSAEAYTELAFRSTAPDFSGDITDVRVELNLQCTYLQGQGPLNLEVRQLAIPLGDTTYYGFDSRNSISLQLVNGNFTVDPVKLNEIRTDLKDATKKPEITIPIRTDEGFFTEANLETVDFATSDAFRAAFKGINISASGSNAAIGFGASGTSLGDSTFVRIRYKQNGTEKKYLFNLSGRRFHNITPVWGIGPGWVSPTFFTPTTATANTDFGKVIESGQTGDLTFIQSGTGLRTYVSFPTITQLREKLGDIAVNKAELIVPVETEANPSFYSAPADLLITEANPTRDASGKVTKALIAKSGSNDLYLGTDSNPNSLQISKFIESSGGNKGYYKIQLTNYLQNVIYGTKQNNGLILFGLGYSARLDRAKVLAPITPGDPSRMRLRIYYTRIK